MTTHWFSESFSRPESLFEADGVDIWIVGDKVTIGNDHLSTSFPLEELEKFIKTHRTEMSRRAAVDSGRMSED